jgi:hypothetical protein
MHLHGGGAKVSAVTPEEMAFYATPAEPFVPEEPPVFDATRTPNIRGVLSLVCIEDANSHNFCYAYLGWLLIYHPCSARSWFGWLVCWDGRARSKLWCDPPGESLKIWSIAIHTWRLPSQGTTIVVSFHHE